MVFFAKSSRDPMALPETPGDDATAEAWNSWWEQVAQLPSAQADAGKQRLFKKKPHPPSFPPPDLADTKGTVVVEGERGSSSGSQDGGLPASPIEAPPAKRMRATARPPPRAPSPAAASQAASAAEPSLTQVAVAVQELSAKVDTFAEQYGGLRKAVGQYVQVREVQRTKHMCEIREVLREFVAGLPVCKCNNKSANQEEDTLQDEPPAEPQHQPQSSEPELAPPASPEPAVEATREDVETGQGDGVEDCRSVPGEFPHGPWPEMPAWSDEEFMGWQAWLWQQLQQVQNSRPDLAQAYYQQLFHQQQMWYLQLQQQQQHAVKEEGKQPQQHQQQERAVFGGA